MIIDRFNAARSYWAAEGLGPFLVRSVAGTGALRFASMIASFLVGVQLARGLGVKGYGYYGIALAVVSLAGVPAEMGLPPLVTREVAAADAKANLPYLLGVLRWARRVAFRLSALMVLAIIVAAAVLERIRPSPLAIALIAGAPIIPLLALTKVSSGALRGLREIVRSQIPANLLRPAAMSLLLFVIYFAGEKLQPWMAVGLNAVTALASCLLAAIWLNRRLPRLRQVDEASEGRRWISSMIPLALAQGMQSLQGQMSVLLLGLLTTAAEVGLFRISVSTAVMLAIPQAIIVTVSLPVISRLHAQADTERLQLLLTRAARAEFCGVLLLTLPLFIAPRAVLTIVYGHQYAAAADVLRIVLLGQLITVSFGLNASVLNMTNHERRVTRAIGIALIMNALTLAALVPVWGARGAALGYAVSVFTWNVTTWLDARRLLGIDTSILPISRAQPKPAG